MVRMKTIVAIATCALLFLEVCEAHVDTDVDPDASLDLRYGGLIGTKVGALVVLFFVAFSGTLLPYCGRKRNAFLLLGTQFAGGVFLATTLMHFLFDADVTFKVLWPSAKYSLAAMFTVVGYLLTMLADLLVHRVHNLRAFQQLRRDQHLESQTETGPEMKAAILKTLNLFDTVLLLVTLCFHSIFDGITIGVSASGHETFTKSWMVGLHKVVLGIAMGITVLRLVSPRQLRNLVLYGFAFSISTSVGVAIGILMNSTAENAVANWIFALWMSLGTGVFVYVVINHLLAWDNHKLVHQDQALFRWLAVLSGAVVTGVVLIWD